MITVRRRSAGLPYSQKWFARATSPADALRVVAYYQYLGEGRPLFLIRQPFTTMHIDLAQDPDAITAGMHRNVRAEIRRADGDGVSWEAGFDHSDFARFHSSFARERGIEGVEIGQLQSFGAALLLTRVLSEGKTLAQHAYVVDTVERRARFLYSSSGRFEDTRGALVGRANRWCHWKDMMHLRAMGIRTYDMGGIAVGELTADVAGVNEFKVRFGGTIVREDHWVSPLFALARMLRGHA
jgi:hypothetical protein